ncbi:hypothetical protein [Hymenobacter lucidus]|uniref:Uncharacterized protein n=1 Tax=Hymenobacter lucidus TaxID=2880930 RepID=A0ABS8APZ2_9BACT|nr:hypothetical protein [Hymenobacter lucidus]MCB2407401.1 hypothetical protein [Hymenobacter lucidus]
MSYDCTITRYSPDFATPIPIKPEEWQRVVQRHAALRFASSLRPEDTIELLTTAPPAAEPKPVTGISRISEKLSRIFRKQHGTAHPQSSSSTEYWLAVLSLSASEAYFPVVAFQRDGVLDLLLEIASELQACIIGQDGEVYFVPGIGLVWDEISMEGTLFNSIEELQQFRQKHGSTYEKAAKQLLIQRGW